MSEIVNLRMARKQRKRAEAREQAAARTGTVDSSEAERLRREADLERRRLEGHRRDEPER